MEIISPIDGDMLHARDGITEGDSLSTTLVIAAPADHVIMVGGMRAEYRDGFFTAPLVLKEYENRITATDEETGEAASVTVYRLKYFVGGYRLSIDDNIWFLRD